MSSGARPTPPAISALVGGAASSRSGSLGRANSARERLARAAADEADDVADLLLEHDPHVLRRQRIGSADMREQAAVPIVGWPAKGNSRAGVKILMLAVLAEFVRLEDEDRLGQIEFGRDRLHAAVVEACRRRARPRADCRRAESSVKTSSVKKRRVIAGNPPFPDRGWAGARVQGLQQPGTVKLFGRRFWPRRPTVVWSISGMYCVALIESNA